MLDALHTEYHRWLKAAKINHANYVKIGDQRTIAASEKSIASLEKSIKELEDLGANFS